MEVHHHSHHPKKWKEYISEFFMLFLAVFAGFLAESYLEYRTDRHKEHDYLVSLIADLRIDSDDISQKEVTMKEVSLMGIKLSDIFYEKNWVNKYADSAYIWSENMCATEVILQYADGTIDQLKNAGGFRLIRSKLINEKIKEYIKHQNRIKFQENDLSKSFQNLLNERDQIMYMRMFKYSGDVLKLKLDITLNNDKLKNIAATTGSKFLTSNQTDFIKFSNKTYGYSLQLAVYRSWAVAQKEKAIELIKIIEEEIK